MEKDTAASAKANRFSDNYLVQAWLCILLALFFGFSLAGVQAALGPVIAANKVNETKDKVPELVLGRDSARSAALNIESRTIEIKKKSGNKVYTVYEASYPDGQRAGWVTKLGGQGYADRIELLLGLDAEARTITGLFILDQKETPGLGNKISEPAWRDQFISKSTLQPLKVIKGGGAKGDEIDAVSGATISSRSVVAIVNNIIHDLKQPLVEAAQQEKEK